MIADCQISKRLDDCLHHHHHHHHHLFLLHHHKNPLNNTFHLSSLIIHHHSSFIVNLYCHHHQYHHFIDVCSYHCLVVVFVLSGFGRALPGPRAEWGTSLRSFRTQNTIHTHTQKKKHLPTEYILWAPISIHVTHVTVCSSWFKGGGRPLATPTQWTKTSTGLRAPSLRRFPSPPSLSSGVWPWLACGSQLSWEEEGEVEVRCDLVRSGNGSSHWPQEEVSGERWIFWGLWEPGPWWPRIGWWSASRWPL